MLEALKQWAFTLILTAVAGSISVSVSNSPNIKKYIKFACALVALAVMIAPINSLFRGLPDIFNYNQNSQAESEVYNSENDFDLRQIIIEKSTEILEQRISSAIEQKIGIKPENIYIYSNINNKNTEADVQIEIEKVIVDMPEKADITNEDLNWIQAYLKEILDCEIIIE